MQFALAVGAYVTDRAPYFVMSIHWLDPPTGDVEAIVIVDDADRVLSARDTAFIVTRAEFGTPDGAA
jgi:hypothetical protein